VTTKLSVTVAVDLDLTAVTIRVAGLIDTENVRGLLAVVNRAEHIFPDFVVRLDQERLHSASPETLDLLRRNTTLTTASSAGGHNVTTRARELGLAA